MGTLDANPVPVDYDTISTNTRAKKRKCLPADIHVESIRDHDEIRQRLAIPISAESIAI